LTDPICCGRRRCVLPPDYPLRTPCSAPVSEAGGQANWLAAVAAGLVGGLVGGSPPDILKIHTRTRCSVGLHTRRACLGTGKVRITDEGSECRQLGWRWHASTINAVLEDRRSHLDLVWFWSVGDIGAKSRPTRWEPLSQIARDARRLARNAKQATSPANLVWSPAG
jgi:hypothetical protein